MRNVIMQLPDQEKAQRKILCIDDYSLQMQIFRILQGQMNGFRCGRKPQSTFR